MKINHTLFLLALLAVFSGIFGFVSPTQAALVDIQACDDSLFAGGDGSEETPWQIATTSQLYNVTFCSDSNNTGNYFQLVDDIVIGEDYENMYHATDTAGWMPIGSYYQDGHQIGEFNGVFDGNHHVVSDLYIARDEGYQGLFSQITADSVVYDLGMERVDIEGFGPGAITSALQGTIRTSYVKDAVISGIGNSDAGGMVAQMYSTSAIEDSYVHNVSVESEQDAFIGGIAGIVGGGAQINRVYAEGEVTLNDSEWDGVIGGVAGGGYDANGLEDSFAVAGLSYDVDSAPSHGGVVGKWGETSEEGNNYWYDPEGEDGEEWCVGEYIGGFCAAASSTNQFRNANNGPLAVWDIENTQDEDWEEFNDGYPFLAWERYGDDAETVWEVFGYEEPAPEPEPEEEEEPSRRGGSRKRSSGGGSTGSKIVAVAPTTQTTNSAGGAESSVSTSVRDLTLTFTGDDVRKLQAILIEKNTGPKALELARVGATGYFGTYTRDALAEYQAPNGIVPAIGYFGPLTRAQMKAAGIAVLWW